MIHLPIQTERLTIRKLTLSDLEAFLSFMLDNESTKFLAFTREQKTEAGARELFNFVIESYSSSRPIHSYAIENQKNHQYIGSCGFADYSQGIFEIYYSINHESRSQGFATESTKALINYLANTSDINEIRAYCHPDNLLAHSVAKKSGMLPKGLALHENFGMKGELFAIEISR